MAAELFQFPFGGGGDITGIFISMAALFVFLFLSQRLFFMQAMGKLEKAAIDFEDMSNRSKGMIIGEISSKRDKRIEDSVNRFFEFFVISPVSLDPYGIIRKMELLVQEQRKRFNYFVDQIAPGMDAEKKANITMGLAGGISLYEISKIMKHYVQIAKMTKNLQIAMILSMQLPFIEKIANAVFKGTQALAKGQPIGDALGPMVAAKLISSRPAEVEEDIVMAETRINGRKIFVIKAKGPGGRLGRPGKAVESLMKKHKIAKIISVDAAAKLEGEKTGSIAEGVGVAMGGVGVERSYIENAAVEDNIPIDSIIVKMSHEEAITPMRKAIKDAIPGVMEAIERSLETVKRNEAAMIIGVGNTSGIGNTNRDLAKVEKWIDQHEKKLLSEEKKKGRFGF